MAVSDLTVIWEYSDSFLYLVSKLNCCCWAFLARSGNGFRFNIPLVTVSVLRQGLAKPSRLAWDSRCPWTCSSLPAVSQLLGLHTQLQDNLKKAAALMCPRSRVLLVVMATQPPPLLHLMQALLNHPFPSRGMYNNGRHRAGIHKCSLIIFHAVGWVGKILAVKEAVNNLWGHSELSNFLLKVNDVFSLLCLSRSPGCRGTAD